METKRSVTKRFVIGVSLIALSLVLGKIIFIPLVMFPGDRAWKTGMLITYIFSWAMLIPGIYLAGKDGYLLVTHKYREYGEKTINTMKKHGKNAAEQTKKAAEQTVRVLKNPVEESRKQIYRLTGAKKKE
jgi:hypothetical protein